MSEFIAKFREENPAYDDLADDQLVTALHNKYYSDIPIEQFNQKIGFQVAPIETEVNQQSDNFIQASPRPEPAQPIQTGYGASRDIPVQQSPMIDGYTGADTKQEYKPMGELVAEKLSAIGEGMVRAGKNVLPQFKSQLGGLMQTQETPLLTPSEFYMNNQQGTVNDIPMQFDSYEAYTEAHDKSQGIGGYIAKKGKELREQANKETIPSTAEKGSIEYYVEQGTSSILNMVPMLAVSIAGKRPDIGLGIMLAQVDGDSYGQGREKGLSQQDAKAYASFQAISEVIPSALPLGKLLSGSGVLSQSLSEGAQEVVTASLQAGIDKGYIDPEMTWGQAVDRMKEAAIIGTGSGATMALATKPFAPKLDSYEDDPLKAVAVEMEREASNKDMKEFISKAVDKETANLIVNDQVEKQGIADELPAQKTEQVQVKPEEVKTEIKQEPIDKATIPEQEPTSFEVPKQEMTEKEKKEIDVNQQVKQKVTGKEVVEAPISEITISEDVPQFKEGANQKGVVEPLGGKFERTGVAPIQIWVREDGRKEVISGRHRLDLAERSGEKTIPAQYHYESEGFGSDQASVLDAMLNIREGQGKVKDYVDFIQATKPRKQEAESQGILARQTGKRAFTIATEGSNSLVTAHRNDQLTDEAATRIAESAPRNEKLQAVGIKAIQDGKTIAVAENMVKAVKYMADESQQDTGDLFGFDDGAMIEAEELAKSAVKKQSAIQKTLSAVKGAAKNPELAKKEGVNVKNPESVKSRIKELEAEKREWSNWHTNPTLTNELKGKGEVNEPTGKAGEFPEAPKMGSEEKAELPKRKVFDWDAVKLSKNYTAKELDQWIKELTADPDNKNLSGGLELYNKSTMKKIDKLTWAVTYLQKEGKEGNTVSIVEEEKSKAEELKKSQDKKKPKLSDVIEEKNKQGKGLTDDDKLKPEKPSYSKEPIQAYNNFRESVGSQKATAEEIKADAQDLIDNKEKVISAMSERKFTKAMLQKMIYSPRSDLSKPQMVQNAYQQMLSAHVMSDAVVTIIGGGKTFEEQIIEQVTKQTQSDVDNAYEKQRQYRAEREKQKEEFVKALTNPETLPEFKEFIRVRGKDKMTSEQLKTYDELVSESLKPEGRPVVVAGETERVKTERAQTKHSKTGVDLFVVKMVDRVEKDKFRELNAKAKKLGGYYSAYSKDGAIPGFQFKTIEGADQFEQLLTGEDVNKSDFAEAKAEVKQSKNAQKLLDMADKMEDKATEEINRPRQANTARRASMASNATERAEKQLALAKTVRNIGTRLQEGELNHLGKISQVTQLEELISIQKRAIPNDLYEHGSFDGYSISRPLKQGVTVEDYISNVEFPKIDLDKGTVRSISESLKGKRGYARLSADLKNLPTGKRESSVLLSKEQADKIMQASKAKIVEAHSLSWLPDQVQTLNRLDKLGITTSEQLRAAIRELDSMREVAKGPDPVKQLERALIGKKIEGFFPTPKNLVQQMIDNADIQAGHEVLEPSAGKGNIATEIKTSAPNATLDVVEYNSSLSAILDAKGFNVVGNDFLEHTKQYDRIVMNPPFENFQDIDHVKHAYDLLKPGGKLVAIMGASVKNSRKKAVEFREWLDNAGSYIEDLPEGSFKSSDRPTGVSTVMVTIEKNDVNTLEYKKLDSKIGVKPKDGEKVFHAPGHNYIGMFRTTGIPERRDFVFIEGRKLKIPDKPQRIEPIMGKLIQIMGRRIYFGKIKGKSSEGFYRPNVGEIRTRKKNDVEVLAHEMAHYLDFYSNVTLPNFQKLYKEPSFKNEVAGLSYTNADAKIELIEGFAEFTRLWLTNAQEAQIRAPQFYDAFTNLLGKDRKLLNPMRDMQDLMHKFYFQGPDKLGQALIGANKSYKQRFNEYRYRLDSRIRQQTIDRFHAAREVERELTGKIGSAKDSAWKQFRISHGGAEGISDYIMNYGTVNFDENGDLKPTGKSLHDVLEPVKTITLSDAHKGQQKIDVLLRYFAGRRALELHRQGRENLIPKETAKEWARLGKEYPVFESIQKEYQAFNDRMMDFYEDAGMITPAGRKAMKSMNKDYVPFNRIRDQLAGGKTGVGGGIQRLKGGTANLNDILVNMQDGIMTNVRTALTNKAKQRLYQYISNHKDGAIFATKLAPDSKPVQVYSDEMQAKIEQVLKVNGIEIEGDLDLTDSDLLTFWQHGVKPKLNESGNIVDQVIIDGKPKYYEVQDPLLQEMLLSMNPESYGSFMNIMFGIKNLFTRSITLGVEFTGANLVRDTIGATFLSKNNFKPFLSSFNGMYSFFKKDEHYQAFVRSGGGYSGRLEASTREGNARRKVRVDEFGVLSVSEKLLSSIDNLASAFEYGTRIGEFKLAKKNGKSDMEAGFDAREISTDFSAIGANRFLTGYIRTVPFLNAMIQSQDRVYREALVSKKYDGNPVGMAMKAMLGITIPTLILYLQNKDDEDYQEIPDYEKRTNWHIKIPDTNQFVKIPRPYDVGFVYATMPELFFKYIEDDKGKEFAEGMIWTMTQMYGIDGVPAMMTGWWDLVRNEKWTGAPVVPQSLANVEATEQYTSNTSETFVRMGEALGISPIKAEHMFKAYTGYLGGYALWGTDHLLWDESKFGEKPDSKTSDNIFLRRFLTPDVRPSSSAMEKFFDLKEKSDQVVATFKQTVDVRRKIKGQGKDAGKFKSDKFFGLSDQEKKVLFGLNDSMNTVIKVLYGKEGIKTAELAIKYDKKLSGQEKRIKIDKLWNTRNDLFMKYYTLADQALQKAKREAKQEK